MGADRLFTHPDVDPATVAEALDHAGYVAGCWQSVRRTLLDTFDGRLQRAGLTLEAFEDDGVELVLIGGGPSPAHLSVVELPTVVTDLPIGPLRARLAPVLEVRALRPVLTLTNRRLVARRRDRVGKTVVAVTIHDRLAVDRPLRPPWVAEVNEMEGYPKAAARARQQLRQLDLRPHDVDLFAAAAAVADVDLRGFSASPGVRLDRADPATEGFRRVLSGLAHTIDATWQGTVDDVDAEFLHDLRIAVRRTRSVLALGKEVVPSGVRDRFRAEFAWLGGATGPARDLEVYLMEWPAYVEPLGPAVTGALRPVLDHIAARRRAEQTTLAGVLRSERYRRTMEAWHEWLALPPDPPNHPAPAVPLGSVVADRLRRTQRRLVVAGRRIGPTTPAEGLHELRKDAKKVRYLLECFGSLLPPRPRRAYVEQLKALQSNLGEFQDTEVHAGQLVAISHQLREGRLADADVFLAIGQLTEHLERRSRAARDDFARRFATYDTRPTQRAFEQLLRAASR